MTRAYRRDSSNPDKFIIEDYLAQLNNEGIPIIERTATIATLGQWVGIDTLDAWRSGSIL